MKKLILALLFVMLCATLLFVFTTIGPFDSETEPYATTTPPFPLGEGIENARSTTTTSQVPTETEGNSKLPNLSDQETLDDLFAAVKQHGWRPIDYEGTIYEKEATDWHLEFQYEFKRISLAVLGFPGLQKQKEAESVLLETLGVTEEQACALGVVVYWKNRETEFQIVDKQLSFCQ